MLCCLRRRSNPSPPSPLSMSHTDAGSGTGEVVTSKTEVSPGYRGSPLKLMAIELLVNEILDGSNSLDASFVTLVIAGTSEKLSTKPLNPPGPTLLYGPE